MMLVEAKALIWGNVLSLLVIAAIFSCDVSHRLACSFYELKLGLLSLLPPEVLFATELLWPFGTLSFVNLLLLVVLGVDVFAWVQYRTEVYRQLLRQEGSGVQQHHGTTGVLSLADEDQSAPSMRGPTLIGDLLHQGRERLEHSVLGASTSSMESPQEVQVEEEGVGEPPKEGVSVLQE